MKNHLPLDNLLKTRQPINAGKGGLQAAIAGAYSHRALLDAADDVQSHRLQLVTFDKDFRRLMKRSMVMVLPTK